MGNTNIRITMRNNSMASTPSKVVDLIEGLTSARHNGGKVVIATCAQADVDAVCDRLDAAHQVASYEVA